MSKKNTDIKIVKGIELINQVNELPKPKFLWHGIPEESSGLITGIAKTGKTTLAENLAISLCTGRKSFLNHKMDGKPRKVLYVNLEESARLRSLRNNKQLSKLTESQLSLFSENYITTPMNFIEFVNGPEDWELLSHYIRLSGAEVVFLDSLTHMLVGEIEKSSVFQTFVQNYRKYIKNLPITVIMVHHNVKGNDRPIDQSCIAGSRVVSQEFEYAIGLSKIPSGGNYLSMLYNKHIADDETKAVLYSIDDSGWINYAGQDNKYNLYKDYNKKDGRIDDENKNIVYDTMVDLINQGNQTISTSDLKVRLVNGEDKLMSLDTLHNAINKLLDDGKVNKVKRGRYILKVITDESRSQNVSTTQ